MKTEDWFKGEFVKQLRLTMPGCVTIRHEDQYTAGVPDISHSWMGHTSWWEAKAVCPTPGRELRTTGVQILTCSRLDVCGSLCRYLVWLEDGDGPVTLAVKAESLIAPIIHHGMTKIPAKQVRALGIKIADGHDFKQAAEFVRQIHGRLRAGEP